VYTSRLVIDLCLNADIRVDERGKGKRRLEVGKVSGRARAPRRCRNPTCRRA
jgi:hypothetical protein